MPTRRPSPRSWSKISWAERQQSWAASESMTAARAPPARWPARATSAAAWAAQAAVSPRSCAPPGCSVGRAYHRSPWGRRAPRRPSGAGCGADGLRRTPQREAILEALGDAGDGLPLPVLLARSRRRAPGLGERTAERTVALLVEAGAVDAIAAARRRGRLPALRPRPPPPPGLHVVRGGVGARGLRRGRLGGRRGRAPGIPGRGPRPHRARHLRRLPLAGAREVPGCR